MRLRDLGWIEGRTIAIEYRWSEGRNERLAETAAELVPPENGCDRHVGNPTKRRGQAGNLRHSNRVRSGGRPSWSQALLSPWHDPAATPPACRCNGPMPPASVLSCCEKLCPICADWRSRTTAAIPWICTRRR